MSEAGDAIDECLRDPWWLRLFCWLWYWARR